MKVIVCVEDRGGMLFNGRRLSRDRLVTLDMLVEACRERRTIEPFSAKLFRGNMTSVHPVENLWEEEGCRGTCLVETSSLKGKEDQIDTLVIYRWNKCYPFDMALRIDLDRYQLEETCEFPGYSHEKITKETYRRKEA